MFYRRKDSLPHKNITVKSVEVTESGSLFYFENSSSKERHIGAIGVTTPITGTEQELLEKLKTVLSVDFPAGTIVQISQLATLDCEDTIATYELGKLDHGDTLKTLAKAHAEFYRNGSHTPLVPSSGNLLHKRRVYFGIKIPVKSHRLPPDRYKEVVELIDRTFDGFDTAQITFRRLDEEEYRALIRSVYNPYLPQTDLVDERKDHLPLNEQILPITASVNFNQGNKDTISFNDGEYFAQVLSVDKFPRFASPYIMNDVVGHPSGAVGQMTGPFFVSMNLIYLDQQKGVQRLAVRKQQIDTQYSESIVKFVPSILDQKTGVDILSDEINRNGGMMVDVNLSIVVYGRTERELNKVSTALVTYYPTLGGYGRKFRIQPDKRILRPVFEQALPLNGTQIGYKGLYRTHAMGVRHALCFVPLYGDFKFRETGQGSLFLTRRGEPAMIDIYDSDTNYNGAMFAESGAGKSVAAQNLIWDQLAAGARVWVIDDGRSMEKFADVVGAQYIAFNPDNPICLNPFTTIPEGGLQEEMTLLKTLFAKMAAPNDGLSDKEMPILENAIQQTFETMGNSTTVGDVADFLAQQENEVAQGLSVQLYSFARGSFSQWFNGDATINFESNFIVLEMGELKNLPHLKDVIALMLFSNINRGMKTLGDNRRKVLMIEEAKQWLQDPIMSKGIEEVYARARKDNGSAICVTQSLLDIVNSPSGSSILANTAWMFILKQKAESIKQAVSAEALSLSPYAQNELASVHTAKGKYSEFMFVKDRVYGIYRLVLSPFARVMTSSSGAERTEIKRMMDAGMSATDAINAFMAAQARSTSADEAVQVELEVEHEHA